MCSLDWSALSAIATTIGTGIVGWYTWETQKLRRISQTQVSVAQQQLDALIAGVQPHFLFEFPQNYFMTDNKTLTLTVTNSGGQARNVKAISSEVVVEIPSSVLDTGQGSLHQHWNFSAAPGSSIDAVHSSFGFRIEFEDQHGTVRSQVLERKDDRITRVYNN